MSTRREFNAQFKLETVFEGLREWAEGHIEAIVVAQEGYDQQHE